MQINHKKLYIAPLALSLCATLMLTACNKSQDVAEEAKVDIEQTAPLQAGEDVADANIAVPADTSVIPADAPNIVINKIAQSNTDTPDAENSNASVTSNTDFIAGTPEATLMQALNTLYYGKASDAAQYYDVQGIPNFAQELEKTQPTFQQTVRQIVLKNITYNEDKTQATLTGLLYLVNNEEGNDASFTLHKEHGTWKISG
ncbi:hypothetical protein [Psychrobacter sp. I-STPA6b]|uniref:hypothetical protein n=1 Tax=Psychrobacter sp. I-STPA6b TaxID=2585718 RepID=UPI001D0C8446|nr:hypothetical protein [Psychrobacter sp. I-STPA6b]